LKTKRRLAACTTKSVFAPCSGNNSLLNKINSDTNAWQSNFARSNYDSRQTLASSGCDKDVYSDLYHSIYTNVLTAAGIACLPASFWTVNLGSSMTINTILFIENQAEYTTTSAVTYPKYSNDWL
jgi:hypothetical protein